MQQLYRKGTKTVFIDGGPTLIGAMLETGLLDEIHLTLAPKIVGNEKDSTITMVEGRLFPPNQIPLWKIVTLEKVADEVFIRYQKR